MLQPLLQAANEAFSSSSSSSSSKTLHFAMGGEMGGTLLNHPAQYLKIFKNARAAWKSPACLRLGVTFYHAYTPGQVIHKPDPKGIKPRPDSSLGALDGGYGPLLPFSQWPGVGRVSALCGTCHAAFQATCNVDCDWQCKFNYVGWDEGQYKQGRITVVISL
jgi:hypothetical protein